MEKLKEKLWKELEEISHKPNMSVGDLEAVREMTETIKNICEIDMFEKGDGYSHDKGGWMDEGAHDRGPVYANRGYRRDKGYSGKRDSRGRYSREDARSEMMEHLEMALDAATEEDREDIKRFMRRIENA